MADRLRAVALVGCSVLFVTVPAMTAADTPPGSEFVIEAVRAAAQPVPALERDATGWRDRMPPEDFAGWYDYPWPPGSSRTESSPRLHEQWRVKPETGNLEYIGTDHSHLLSDEILADFVLHVEFRYTEPDAPGSNSGIFVRMAPGETVMHQIELAHSSGVMIGGRLRNGTLQRIKVLEPGENGAWVAAPQHSPRDWERRVTKRIDAPVPVAPDVLGISRPIERHPKGEWNTIEVTCVGPVIVVTMNGAVTTYTDQCYVAAGAIGFEAEGHPIEFRNLKVRLLR